MQKTSPCKVLRPDLYSKVCPLCDTPFTHHKKDTVYCSPSCTAVGEKLRKRWKGIKERCVNPNHCSYHVYGGKGISVCPEWQHSFYSFLSWARSNGLNTSLQVDRIDNSKGYSPENCRFVTNQENSHNRDNQRMITAFGETKTFSSWLKDDRCKCTRTTLNNRIYHLNWDHEIALSTPKLKSRHSRPF